MPTRTEIQSHVTDLLAEMFEIDPADITLEANLYEDLDIDSIDAVDLVVKLKEWTGEKIAPDDFKNVRTIADVVDAIAELVSDTA